MNQVTGVVSDIPVLNTKTGKTMYSIVVNGEKFGVGMYAPKCAVGDTVTFQVSMNGQYKNVENKTLVVQAGVPRQAPSAAPSLTSASANSGTFDNRQDTIFKQAALNTAIAFAKLAHEAGALPSPTKVKDKLEALDAIVKQYARDFYQFSTGKTLEVPAGDKAVAGLEDDGEWK